jgi:hypothetical protein
VDILADGRRLKFAQFTPIARLAEMCASPVRHIHRAPDGCSLSATPLTSIRIVVGAMFLVENAIVGFGC